MNQLSIEVNGNQVGYFQDTLEIIIEQLSETDKPSEAEGYTSIHLVTDKTERTYMELEYTLDERAFFVKGAFDTSDQELIINAINKVL